MEDGHDWELNETGNLVMFPVKGWDVRTTALLGLIRLRYARTEEEFEGTPHGLQVHMTPAQLRMLSGDLLRAAERIEAQHATTRQ